MPPPSNNLSSGAIVVNTFPYMNVQTDISSDGSYWACWYKVVTPPGARMVSVWAYSGNGPTGPGYLPVSSIFSSVAPDIPYWNIISKTSLPVQVHIVSSGQEFWININHLFGSFVGLPTDTLTVKIEIHSPTTIETGDIVINNDFNGDFPTAVFSHTTSNTVKDYWKEVTSAGEAGDILPTRIFCLENNGFIRIYDASHLLIHDVEIGETVAIRRDADATKFWLGYAKEPFGNMFIRTLSPDGVLGAETETDGIEGMPAICANSGNHIMYAGTKSDGPIYRWNLDTNTLMTNFAAGISGHVATDILVLSDGTIAVLYIDILGSPSVTHLYHYDTAGAIINHYNLGSTGSVVPRMGWALDNPNSVWVMDHVGNSSTGSYITFRNVKMSDGTILTSLVNGEYNKGKYAGPFTSTPVLFGQANSCPILIWPSGDVVVPPDPPTDGPPGGLLWPNPLQRHDSYYGDIEKKIPNPTVRTALIGE